jgi:hypothetical protein
LSVSKNEKTGKWEVRIYYKDFTGTLKQKTKRGFDKKFDAIDWERAFKIQQNEDLDTYFKDFVELYIRDKKPRGKYNTWLLKETIIEKKIMPYFEKKKLSEIRTTDVIQGMKEHIYYDRDNNIQLKVVYYEGASGKQIAFIVMSNMVYNAGCRWNRKSICLRR